MENNAPRHSPESDPFQQTADALANVAKSSRNDQLETATKQQQRQDLYTLASSMMSSSPLSAAPEAPLKVTPAVSSPWWSRKPLKFAGAIAMIALLLNLSLLAAPWFRSGSHLSYLVIPEAQAATAFSVEPLKSQDTQQLVAWEIHSLVPASVKDIETALKIEPSVPVTIEQTQTGTFRVTPTTSLVPETIYRVSLAAIVRAANGQETARQFSWATQTQADFQILGVTPRHQTTDVPVNTVVEIITSREDGLDPTPFFSLSPATKGKFEKRARAWVFIPEKPLAKDSVYTMTLKKGYAAQDGSGALKEDKIAQFQTTGASTAASLTLPDWQEVLVGQPLSLPVYLGDTIASGTIHMAAYPLSVDETIKIAKEQFKTSVWSGNAKVRNVPFQGLTQPIAMQGDIQVEQHNYNTNLVFPTFAAPGRYAVKVTSPRWQEPSWFILQVTNITTEILADRSQVVTWVMDGVKKEPVKQATVTLEGATQKTDDHGLATLPAPSTLQTPGSEPALILLTVGSGDQQVVIRLTRSDQWINEPWRWDAQNTWSYLYPDRPIYRPTDSMQIFGLALDQKTQKPLTDVTLEVVQGYFFAEFGNYNNSEKVFERQTVSLGENGQFKTNIDWKNRLAGWYQLRLKQGDRILMQRGFEVRPIEKPIYTMEVKMDQTHVYAKEMISGTVKVAFYDGTPYSAGKVHVVAGQGNDTLLSQDLTLDAMGQAKFQAQTHVLTCTLAQEYCESQQTINVQVNPLTGEQAEITGGAYVQVASGDRLPFLQMKVDQNTQTANGTVEIHALDWDNPIQKGAIVPNQPVTLEVTPSAWVQVPDGQYYDEVQKVWRERTRSERRVNPTTTFTVRTDAQGKADIHFPVPKPTDKTEWTYRVVARAKDSLNRDVFQVDSVSTFVYTYGDENNNGQTQILLRRQPASDENVKFGEKVTVHAQYLSGRELDEKTQKNGVLFAVLKYGIRQYAVVPSNEFTTTFAKEFYANADVMAVVMTDHGFISTTLGLSADLEDRNLKVTVQPTATSVAPGATSTVLVTVQDQAGHPVENATIAFNVIDQALEGITPLQPETPMGWLYPYSSNGLLISASTHLGDKYGFAGGGAEGGGGGGDFMNTPRKIFKDSAAFVIAETDDEGKATVTTVLPENLTSWRMEAVAVKVGGESEVKAGSAIANVATAKPVFVDAVLPPRLMTGDKATIHLRAFGSALTVGEAVSFLVNAPELGINQVAVTGTVNTFATVPFNAQKPGTYKLTIGVQSAHGTDALERTITVVDHQVWIDQWHSQDLSTDFSGLNISQPETTLTFMSRDRASVLPSWQQLAETVSTRFEIQAAQQAATTMLRSTYQQAIGGEESLKAYQSLAGDKTTGNHRGGLSELVYGDASLRASADVALSAPELIDPDYLAAYLWQMADDHSLDRTSHVMAIAGLAGLHQPVLSSLEEMTAWTDRTSTETAWLLRAWVAVGDTGKVNEVANAWQSKTQTTDGSMTLNLPGEKPESQQFASFAYAMAMESIRDAKADLLWNGIAKNGEVGVESILSEVQYLKLRTNRLPNLNSELVVTLPNQPEQRFVFDKQPVQALRVTQEEAQAMRIKSVSPGIVASWTDRAYQLPTTNSNVTITRQYERNGKVVSEWKAGDLINVRLSTQWPATLGIGGATTTNCQTVRDFLPGNVQPLVKIPRTLYDVAGNSTGDERVIPYYNPLSVDEGSVTLLTCSPGDQVYSIRVVSPGTYTAEAPIVQELDKPSHVSVGKPQTIKTNE